MKIFNILQCMIRPSGLRAFVNSLSRTAVILDIGCGNESSIFYKSISSMIVIDGVDIQDYNQTAKSKNLYRKYLISNPDKFAEFINSLDTQYDAVISNHNLEHCDNPRAVLEAMINVLKPDGRLFLATPSLKSLSFPSREGTLYFFDDNTHNKPITFEIIEPVMSHFGVYIEKSHNGYRPYVWRFIGFILEPISSLKRKVLLGTWDFWGFELIVWAKKK